MTKTFFESINELYFNRLNVEASITVGNENEVVIQSDSEEKLDFRVKGNILVISPKEDEKENKNFTSFSNKYRVFGNNNVVINNMNNVTIINGEVIGGSATTIINEKITLSISVPKGQIDEISANCNATLDIDSISDEIEFDTSGNLKVKVVGVDCIDFDSSGNTKADISDASKVVIDNSGNMTMNVHSKMVNRLEVEDFGRTKITVNADIKHLEVDTSGNTTIDVHGKVYKQEVDKTGICRINTL
jgi:hypothetical protein